MDTKTKFKLFLLILALAFCWGPSFLFIKLAVGEVPPMTLVSCRLALGALMLYGVVRVQGLRLWPYRRHWPHFVVMGVFACALPFFLITYGELTISSSLAAIVNSTTPICTVILAHFYIASERITFHKGMGVLLGFAGIIVVFAPSVFVREPDTDFGAFLIFLAALSYAIGMVYSKQHFSKIPPLVGANAQLVAAALMLIPLALVFEEPYALSMPSWTAIGGIFGLAILGTATAFPLYYAIVKKAGPTAVSTSTLLFPVIGIFLGVMLLDEQVGWSAYLGSAMILSGLAIANQLLPFKSRRGIPVQRAC